ncbi:hypothetical protein MHU86_9084 [Fragilaria crotonensis]|nr:hypothetical protein MHU86_9084 [Fragilaria crotonensis]
MNLQPIISTHSEYVQEESSAAVHDRISVEPTVQDVLCGRGKDCFHHEGNIRFRALIEAMLSQYTISRSKKHKMQIIQFVVQTVIQGGGRFLKKEDRPWYDGGIACGKDKKRIAERWYWQHSNWVSKQGGDEATKAITALSGDCSQTYLCESRAAHVEYMSTAKTNRRGDVTAATNTVYECGDAIIDTRMREDAKTGTPVVAKDEFETAATSLLFLQRAVYPNPIESPRNKGSQAKGIGTALPSCKTPGKAVIPFRQVCAASVPSESHGTNAFYFI